METIVASGSSLASSVPIEEKGSRNKRKFSGDPPNFDSSFISDQTIPDCSSFDFSQFDLNHEMFSLESYGHGNNNVCTASSCCHPKEKQLHEAEWNEVAESELEETLLRNLNMMFKSAIIKIMSHGYNEEAAIVSILRTGLCFGVKDFVTSIVDSALLFLKSGCEFDYVIGDKLFEDLNRRVVSALNEMIGVVKDFRPTISRGEAMWRLLVSDMNVIYACSIGSAFSSSPCVGVDHHCCKSGIQANPVSNSLGSHKPSFALPSPKNTTDKDAPSVFGVTNLPNGSFSASIKESSTSLNCLIEKTSSLFISQPKSSSGKRVLSGRREPILRRKTVHVEKGYRRSIIRAPRNSSISGVVFDRKTKTLSDSDSALSMKDTLIKINKVVGNGILPPKADISLNLSSRDMPIKLTDIANTELSLSLPSSSKDGIFISPDNLDEMLQKLCVRERVLEAERQDWTEWAQQKVMEAAHRLGKDKLELQSLRSEKDEVSRLKKEKQALENSTRKKLAELEIALSETCAEIEQNNTVARNMERENIELKKALVVMKFEAAESAANYRKFCKKDLNIDKDVRFREREKAHLREELANKKKMSSYLKEQLEQAKIQYDQLEAKCTKQETMKQEHLDHYNALRKEEDLIKISFRSKENELKLNAETDLQRHKDYIQKLELQVLQLRQKTDSSKIAALKKWSISPETTGNNTKAIYKFFELQDDEEEDDVDREKECVMCLNEEMSVLFLPCTHQVLCEGCNEMHEKQGMKDCPSCRTKIEKRVIVCSA